MNWVCKFPLLSLVLLPVLNATCAVLEVNQYNIPSYTQCKGNLGYHIFVIRSLHKTLFLMGFFFLALWKTWHVRHYQITFKLSILNLYFEKTPKHVNQHKILLKLLLWLEITMNHPTWVLTCGHCCSRHSPRLTCGSGCCHITSGWCSICYQLSTEENVSNNFYEDV